MRIPLDYYRILSVPIQANSEQLQQAYSDRLLQQPRREYNEQAILARQELLQYAYEILSDSEQRAAYDAQFLVSMQPVETVEISEILATGETAVKSIAENPPAIEQSANPTIEIPASQLVGALLVLYELGEYELVLQVGIDYFSSREFSELQQQQDEATNTATRNNIILSLALAYLELGREQWHRGEYENSAFTDRMGLDLLIKENLFSQVQEELKLDLCKLRPYRVLELISQNPANSPDRERGFQLLREMLQQRQGIEGKGEDSSGLSFDQFLCFIQQLRTYLTSAEQQQLFEAEAEHNSAIANYLAVYALLGRGFSLKQPELILRAQRMLDCLSERQDVVWEQSVCALLLGHTEKAIKKLQNSQNITKLELIRHYSPDNTDLLPGMCFYSEKWLQEDVVAQFSDLCTTQVTLKEYFADAEVQTYLEEIVASTTADDVAQTPAVASNKQKSAGNKRNPSATKTNGMGILSRWRNIFSSEKVLPAKATPSNRVVKRQRELVGVRVGASGQETATLERNYQNKVHTGASKSEYRPTASSTRNTHKGRSQKAKSKSLSLPLQPPEKTRAVPPSVSQRYQDRGGKKRQISRQQKKLSKATVLKGWLFIVSLILGVGATGFIAMRLFLNPASRTASQAELAIAIDQPTVELSPVSTKAVAPKPKLTFTEQSQQVIQKWLSTKSAAFGKEYQIERLNTILVEPLLGTWRERAVAYKQGNFYREYEHKIKMRSATINQKDPNKATVEAEVQEIAKHYQSGKLERTKSYNDNLLVRYQLVRQGEHWLIQNSEVLKTL